MLRMTMTIGLVMGLLGCGGDGGGGDDDGGGSTSGLEGSRAMSSLTAEEKTTFCEWAIAEQGGAGTETQCGDDTLTVPTVEQCAQSVYCEACTITVGRLEECTRATANDPCTLGGEACFSEQMDCAFSCMGGA